MDLFFISTSFYNARFKNFFKIKYFSKVFDDENRCDFDYIEGDNHLRTCAKYTTKIGEMQLFKIKSFCRKFFKKN